MPSTSELIDSYLDGSKILRQAVAGMSREQLVSRPVPGKWSTLEVVCHLVDSDQAWIHRMKRVIAEDRPLLIGYDESRFARALSYQERDLEEELAIFEQSRRQLARILRTLPASSWSSSHWSWSLLMWPSFEPDGLVVSRTICRTRSPGRPGTT